MKTIRLITMFVLFSSVVCAQHDTEIIQFNNVLNQFHNVRDFCMSKDGAEAFVTIQSPSGEISQIACMKKENNV